MRGNAPDHPRKPGGATRSGREVVITTMTQQSAALIELADELADLREKFGLHPQHDGKLSEAEINLRGVAGALNARRE